jgi:hypothetical protein
MKKIEIVKTLFSRIRLDLILILLISSIILLYEKGIATLLTIGISSILSNIVFIIVLYLIITNIKIDKSKFLEETSWSEIKLVKSKFYIDIILFVIGIFIFFIFGSEFLFEFFITGLILWLFIIYIYNKIEF